MVYTNTQGVILKDKNKLAMFLVAIGFAIFATIGMILPTKAITTPEGSVAYTPVPLTQQELDDNWIVDRAIPSGGYESLTFDDRSDVLEVRIDKNNRSSGSSFYYTEGLKRSVDDKDALKIDLFIDSDWLDNDKDVRAGLWGVGNDDSDTVTAYPIIEFTNSDSFTGWRVWDSFDGATGGWTELGLVGFTPDEWSTLEVFYNEADSMFDFYIDGSIIHSTAVGGTTNFGEVILNSYNYGTDGNSYEVHWSNFELGVFEPDTTPPAQVEGMTIFQNGEEIGCDAIVNERAITVDWDDSEADDFDHYVYQADDGVGTIDFETTTTQSERSGNIRDLDGTYQYRVAAVDTNGNQGDFSEWCMVTLDRSVPEVAADCKKGGWENFLFLDFRNQGDCVSYVVSENQQENNPDGNRNENGARRR